MSLRRIAVKRTALVIFLCGLSFVALASQDVCLRNAKNLQFSPTIAVHKGIVLVAYTEFVGFFHWVVSGSLSENGGETFTYLGQLSPCPACPHQ